MIAATLLALSAPDACVSQEQRRHSNHATGSAAARSQVSSSAAETGRGQTHASAGTDTAHVHYPQARARASARRRWEARDRQCTSNVEAYDAGTTLVAARRVHAEGTAAAARSACTDAPEHEAHRPQREPTCGTARGGSERGQDHAPNPAQRWPTGGGTEREEQPRDETRSACERAPTHTNEMLHGQTHAHEQAQARMRVHKRMHTHTQRYNVLARLTARATARRTRTGTAMADELDRDLLAFEADEDAAPIGDVETGVETDEIVAAVPGAALPATATGVVGMEVDPAVAAREEAEGEAGAGGGGERVAAPAAAGAAAAAATFSVGANVWYTTAEGGAVAGVVLAVENSDGHGGAPYYTIRSQGGEKQTEGNRLRERRGVMMPDADAGRPARRQRIGEGTDGAQGGAGSDGGGAGGRGDRREHSESRGDVEQEVDAQYEDRERRRQAKAPASTRRWEKDQNEEMANRAFTAFVDLGAILPFEMLKLPSEEVEEAVAVTVGARMGMTDSEKQHVKDAMAKADYDECRFVEGKDGSMHRVVRLSTPSKPLATLARSGAIAVTDGDGETHGLKFYTLSDLQAVLVQKHGDLTRSDLNKVRADPDGQDTYALTVSGAVLGAQDVCMTNLRTLRTAVEESEGNEALHVRPKNRLTSNGERAEGAYTGKVKLVMKGSIRNKLAPETMAYTAQDGQGCAIPCVAVRMAGGYVYDGKQTCLPCGAWAEDGEELQHEPGCEKWALMARAAAAEARAEQGAATATAREASAKQKRWAERLLSKMKSERPSYVTRLQRRDKVCPVWLGKVNGGMSNATTKPCACRPIPKPTCLHEPACMPRGTKPANPPAYRAQPAQSLTAAMVSPTHTHAGARRPTAAICRACTSDTGTKMTARWPASSECSTQDTMAASPPRMPPTAREDTERGAVGATRAHKRREHATEDSNEAVGRAGGGRTPVAGTGGHGEGERRKGHARRRSGAKAGRRGTRMSGTRDRGGETRMVGWRRDDARGSGERSGRRWRQRTTQGVRDVQRACSGGGRVRRVSRDCDASGQKANSNANDIHGAARFCGGTAAARRVNKILIVARNSDNTNTRERDSSVMIPQATLGIARIPEGQKRRHSFTKWLTRGVSNGRDYTRADQTKMDLQTQMGLERIARKGNKGAVVCMSRAERKVRPFWNRRPSNRAPGAVPMSMVSSVVKWDILPTATGSEHDVYWLVGLRRTIESEEMSNAMGLAANSTLRAALANVARSKAVAMLGAGIHVPALTKVLTQAFTDAGMETGDATHPIRMTDVCSGVSTAAETMEQLTSGHWTYAHAYEKGIVQRKVLLAAWAHRGLTEEKIGKDAYDTQRATATPRTDVLIMTPECGKYSRMTHDEETTRKEAQRMEKLARHISAAQPRVVVFETVSEMLTSETKREYMGIIMTHLRSAAGDGYHWKAQVVDAEAHCDEPMHRARAFVVATTTQTQP